MTIDAMERMTTDSGAERSELRHSGRDRGEEFIPVKQVLRWQDDGGAIFPNAR